MVFSAELSKEFDKRIDLFFEQWGLMPSSNGYRFAKETVAYMIAHPGAKPYSAMREVAEILGLKFYAFREAVIQFVNQSTPPSTFYTDGIKLSTKDFLNLCMNTVLQE